MSEEKEDYGSVTIGWGKSDQRELKIIDFVRSEFKDNRMAQCCQLEDGTYCIALENYESSGRNTVNIMRLSEESFMAVIANITLYAQIKGWDLVDMTKKALDGDVIKYNYSDNLSPKQ